MNSFERYVMAGVDVLEDSKSVNAIRCLDSAPGRAFETPTKSRKPRRNQPRQTNAVRLRAASSSARLNAPVVRRLDSSDG